MNETLDRLFLRFDLFSFVLHLRVYGSGGGASGVLCG